MRTHIYNKMTADEVEAYLSSGRDTIILAVGPTEIHGEAPVDIENAYAQAFSLAMAEKVDAIAMINLPYFYPGGTAIGRATVHTSLFDDIEYLFDLCNSLVSQGFRKILMVPGHGAITMALNPFIRDFFEATHIHPVVVNQPPIEMPPAEFTGPGLRDKFLTAAVYTMIRQPLKNIPVDASIERQNGTIIKNDPRLRSFADTVRAYGGVAALAFSDRLQHGGGYIYRNEEERDAYAKLGEKLIRDAVDKLDLKGLLDALDTYQKYVAEVAKAIPRINNLP